ncbi:MAG: hypothetical protein Q7T63_15550 [Burkholderiaceae bacterium]|nr:hypothetical protein [Burkholderiaceae bacterium]MDO9090156.1 hypothetical protein [Burkholderiaceae bacterium]
MKRRAWIAAFLAGLGWMISAAAWSAQGAAARRIDYVYMGGNDCPPCIAWRQTELPRLKAMPEFQLVHFTYVNKSIRSPVPGAVWFPHEIRALREPIFVASKGRTGSPLNAIVVDGRVAIFWWGAWAAEDIAKTVREIHSGIR